MRQTDDNFTGREAELLAGLKAGEAMAFERIFRLYWSDCYQLAFSIIHETEPAEEAVQDVFINIWKNRENMRIDKISPYLYAATKQNILKYIRSKASYNKHLEYYRRFCDVCSNTTEHEVSHNELRQLFAEATLHLNKKTKEIFRLSRMEGFSNSEISKRMNITEKAVEYHITQSLRFLKRRLKDFLIALLVSFSSLP